MPKTATAPAPKIKSPREIARDERNRALKGAADLQRSAYEKIEGASGELSKLDGKLEEALALCATSPFEPRRRSDGAKVEVRDLSAEIRMRRTELSAAMGGLGAALRVLSGCGGEVPSGAFALPEEDAP